MPLSKDTTHLFTLRKSAALVLIAMVPLTNASELKTEIAALLSSHPQITTQQNRIEISEYNKRVVDADKLPSLDLVGTVGPENINPATGSATTRLDKKTASLSFKQNLFSGYSNEALGVIADIDNTIEKITLQETRQNLILSGMQVYIDVLKQHALSNIAKKNTLNIKKLLELEQERYKHGANLAADILQAKIRLALANERQSFFQNELDNAITRYIAVFNHAPDMKAMQDIQINTGDIPENLDMALAAAGNYHPALQKYRSELSKARQNIRVEKSGFAPNVDLVGNANWQENASGIEGIRKDNSLLFQLRWNLFNGRKTSSLTRAAETQVTALNEDYAYQVRETEKAVRLFWEQYNNSKTRLGYLNNAVDIAADLFKNRQALRAAGQNTAQEVLDARSEYFTAQISNISAIYDSKLAAISLLQACGLLRQDTVNQFQLTDKKFYSDAVETNSLIRKQETALKENQIVKKESSYVLQLMAAKNPAGLTRLIEQHPDLDLKQASKNQDGNEIHLLLFGNFDSFGSAKASIESLPTALKKMRPWVRKLESTI